MSFERLREHFTEIRSLPYPLQLAKELLMSAGIRAKKIEMEEQMKASVAIMTGTKLYEGSIGRDMKAAKEEIYKMNKKLT